MVVYRVAIIFLLFCCILSPIAPFVSAHDETWDPESYNKEEAEKLNLVFLANWGIGKIWEKESDADQIREALSPVWRKHNVRAVEPGDFIKAGDEAVARGDLATAEKWYNKGIENINLRKQVMMGEGPTERTEHERDLWGLWGKKAELYKKMPGHEAEAAAAERKSESYLESYDRMSKEIHELSGFECLIATATFNSPMAPQVQLLRDFRDGQVQSTKSGTQFMGAFNAWYYSFSPYVADYIDANPWTKAPMQIILTPLIAILTLASMAFAAFSFSPEAGVVLTGFIASSLIGLVYVTPAVLLVLAIARHYHRTIVNMSLVKGLLALAGISLAVIAAGSLLNVALLLLVGASLFVISVMLLTAFSIAWVCDRWIYQQRASTV